MPDLSPLLELTSQVRAPDLDRLADLADRRRRRFAAVVSGGLAVTAAIAVVAATGAIGRDTTSGPVGPGPSLSPSPSPTMTFPALTAEEIRNHPDARPDSGGDYPATASDAVARVWTVCLDDCSRRTEYLPGESQSAFEISRDGFRTGAVYLLPTGEGGQHVVDDWFLISTWDGAVMVDSRGRQRPMELGGPVDIEEVDGPIAHSRLGVGYLDLEADLVHPIRGAGYWEWGGADDTWFWGVASMTDDLGKVVRQAAVWRNPDGTWQVRVLPIPVSDGGPGLLRAGIPGTMAVVEHFRQPRLVHVSDDYGATWQVRQVPDDEESGGRLPEDWRTWPRG